MLQITQYKDTKNVIQQIHREKLAVVSKPNYNSTTSVRMVSRRVIFRYYTKNMCNVMTSLR